MQQCTGKGRKEEYLSIFFKCTLRRANCNGVIMCFHVGKQAESVVYVLHWPGWLTTNNSKKKVQTC